MKLAIITLYPPLLSGLAQYGKYIADALSERGRFASINVLTQRAHSTPVIEQHGKLTIERLWQLNDWYSAWFITQALQRLKPDVVWFNLHLQTFGTSYIANFLGLLSTRLAQRLGYRTVVTLHAIPEAVNLDQIKINRSRVVRHFAHWITEQNTVADAIVTLTSFNAQILREHYGVQDITVIPHPAYYIEWPFQPNGHFQVLIYTLHAPFKGLPLLIEAIQHIRRGNPEVELSVAGGEHPRFAGYLQGIQAAYRNTPGIRWLGILKEEQIPEVLSRASLLVLPYEASTGASGVLQQACAFGLPVLASDLPEFRHMAQEQNLQVEFFPAKDVFACELALRQLLFNPDRLAEISEHNRQIGRRFAVSEIAKAYSHVFERVTSTRFPHSHTPFRL